MRLSLMRRDVFEASPHHANPSSTAYIKRGATVNRSPHSHFHHASSLLFVLAEPDFLPSHSLLGFPPISFEGTMGKSRSAHRVTLSTTKPCSSYLGPSTMTEAKLGKWAREPDSCFVRDHAHVPPLVEMTLVVRPGRLIIFAKLLEGGLRFPCSSFVGEVLDLFGLEIHHITLNTMIRLHL